MGLTVTRPCEVINLSLPQSPHLPNKGLPLRDVCDIVYLDVSILR